MTRFGGARRVAARGAVRVATAVAVLAATSYASFAGNSPQGDTAVAWPTAWNAYTSTSGVAVMDVLGDENPANSDLASGPCSPTTCTGGEPTVHYASDGTTAFFRVRLAVDPSDATKGGLTGNAYLTQIAVDGVVKAVVGVDGKSASVDYVYTATAPGTTVTSIYEWPFTSPSAGMRVLPASGGEYYLDYQVPIARITTASGGAITASTPIQLYYGSSAAANLATINKDFMRGTATSVVFDGLSVVSLVPGSLSATSAAVAASGPNPPVAGSPTTYTVTLTMTNAGGGALTGATATATLPAGVTYVSGPVSMSGSTLTWNAGTLLPSATDSVVVTVSLTPSAAGATPLLSALSATGEDAATGTKTASAPALSVTATANDAPVAADDTLTVAEDASGGVHVLANDTDEGGPLTVTVTDPPHGTATEAGGVVTYTPDPGYHGGDSFGYEVCDSGGLCDTATVTVTVTAVNDAPAAPPGDAITTAEDTAKSGTLPGSADPDGDAVTFRVTDEPGHGAVTIAPNGSYTYTPDEGYHGGDSFGYEVCDPSGACAAAVVTVTVTPLNDAPPAPPASAITTAEDTVKSGTLPGSVDPDGDALTFGVTDAPAHGTVTIGPGGEYTYTPDADYFGGDSFGYEVCDPSGACAPAVVTVTVTPVNDAPAAPPASAVSTPEDTVKTGTLPGSVDPDGDALTFGVTDEPAHGTVTVALDGSYTYLPDPDYSGGDSFGYEVCDPSGACAPAVVTVSVTPVNDPPAAPPGTAISTPEETPKSGTLPGSVDPDGDPLTFAVTDQPDHGTVTIGPDGAYTYTPDDGYTGGDSFGYEVCDPSGACAPAVVTVTVTEVNAAPVAADDTVSRAAGLPAVFDPTGNDTDADGDALTITVSDPPNGSVTVAGTTVTYTPDSPGLGADSFTYEVCDPSGACDTATITVTFVTGPTLNSPPTANAGPDVVLTGGDSLTMDGSGSSDPDDLVLSYSWVQTAGPAVTLLAADTVTPRLVASSWPAELEFELTVSDGELSDTDTMTVSVRAPEAPAPPVCDDTAATSGPGGVTVEIPCELIHEDSTFEVVGDPGHGTAEVLESGEIRYVPAPGFTGVDRVTVRICSEGGCIERVVTVTVRDTTAAPDRVVRPRPAPALPGTGLPETGTPADVLVAAAFVLVVVGAGMQRRPKRT